MSMQVRNKGLGIRHLQALLLLSAIFIQFIMRFSISISIVAMTNFGKSSPSSVEFKWTNTEINYVLGGFFWGFSLTQFPGSYLTRLYGVKLILFVSVFGSSLFALITPFCIPFGGWKLLCGIRICQGIFQGLLYPCVYNHLSNWSPVEERNLLGGIALSGQESGALVAMFGSGFIASSSIGWPGIYYISATFGVIFCFLWMIFASNNPLESNWITYHEQNYILSSLDKSEVGGNMKKIPVPWKSILTSIPFWALLVSACSESFGMTIFEAQIPSYLNGVLSLDINKNGIYSSLGYLAMWLMGFVNLFISIFLLKKKVLSLTSVRRTFNTIALWLPAVGFIGIGFLDKEQKVEAVILLIIMMGLHSGTTIGSSLNNLDLAPNHAGVLVGMINTIASGIAIVSPLTVGLIVDDKHDRKQWQLVFIISAMVFFFGNLFYITCGSTELQPWNEPNFQKEQTKGSKNCQSESISPKK